MLHLLSQLQLEQNRLLVLKLLKNIATNHYTYAVPKGLHALYMTLCLYIYLQKLHSGPILSV